MGFINATSKYPPLMAFMGKGEEKGEGGGPYRRRRVKEEGGNFCLLITLRSLSSSGSLILRTEKKRGKALRAPCRKRGERNPFTASFLAASNSGGKRIGLSARKEKESALHSAVSNYQCQY